jgi:putative endonuclease
LLRQTAPRNDGFVQIFPRAVIASASQRSNLLAYIPTDCFGKKRLAMTDISEPGGGDMGKQYYIYIMTNKNNTVLYTGVTNDLKRRVYEHKAKLIEGFTKKYNVDKLVYYEVFEDSYHAIAREKQIKGGSRQKKINLINSINDTWKDLYETL